MCFIGGLGFVHRKFPVKIRKTPKPPPPCLTNVRTRARRSCARNPSSSPHHVPLPSNASNERERHALICRTASLLLLPPCHTNQPIDHQRRLRASATTLVLGGSSKAVVQSCRPSQQTATSAQFTPVPFTPVPFTPVPFIFTQTATSANSSPLPTSRHCRQQRAPPAILRLPPLHALVHGLGSQPSRHIRSVLATPRGSLGGLLFGRDLVNFIRRLRESLHPACAEPAIPPAC